MYMHVCMFMCLLFWKDKSIGAQLKAAERLKFSLNPTYANAFSRIRKLDGGVKFLVDLRADLLVSTAFKKKCY